MKTRFASAVVLALLITGLLGLPGSANVAHQASGNDNFANATSIIAPFGDSFDDLNNTVEPDEPSGECSGYQVFRTAWYKFTTPSAGAVAFSVSGGVYDNFVSIYRATAPNPGFGDLQPVLCGGWSQGSRFPVGANETYYFQLGDFNSYGSGGWIFFSLTFLPPPANDNFANAETISDIPSNVSLDTSDATIETGEPTPPCSGSLYRSVWYKYMPTSSASILLKPQSYAGTLAVWTGSAVDALTSIGCINGYWGGLVVAMQASITYYVQLSTWDQGAYGINGFSLEVTPNPNVSFYYNPSDPSIFDAVQFQDNSWDPAYQGFTSWTWDFGDGATATEPSPTHRYAKDGDYTVVHTATTTDGRTGSISQVVHVQTHDVAITRLQAPNTARVNQTKQIVASITSKRYDETVMVTLQKSTPNGLVTVGQYSQFVPVRPPGGKATNFTFNYTFTPDDLVMGKVTFKAVANYANYARDALPADNEAISPPCKVSK